MSTDMESQLLTLSTGGPFEDAQWPALLEAIVPRLEHIVYNDFPIPQIPFALQQSTNDRHIYRPTDSRPVDDVLPPGKRLKTDADHAASRSASTESVGSKSQPESSSIASSNLRNGVPEIPALGTVIKAPAATLPPALLTMYSGIKTTLTQKFPSSPPHTAQRLSELLLRPRAHYRTLPSYLRAVDRIVAVASPLSDFPLPVATRAGAMTTEMNMINGNYDVKSRDYHGHDANTPGDDKDFIGGAELTEIPWLRNQIYSDTPDDDDNSMDVMHPLLGSSSPSAIGAVDRDLRTESTSLIDGPNGAGSIETVTVNQLNGMLQTRNKLNAHPPSTTVSSTPALTPSTTDNGDQDEQKHGITQGEILRQEQEAGIVPVPATSPNNRVTRSSAAATAAANRAVGMPSDPDEDEPESAVIPHNVTTETHAESSSAGDSAQSTQDEVSSAESEETEPFQARGPNIIGMEDMGPQPQGSALEKGINVSSNVNANPVAATTTTTSSTQSGDDDDRDVSAGRNEEEGWVVVDKMASANEDKDQAI